MAPFDGSGVPQQGQPGGVGQPMQRGPMPPGGGHVGNPSPVGMPGGGHPMSNPAYGHQHHNGGMSGQPPPYHPSGMPSQSPARQGNFNPMSSGGGPPQAYSTHPPLHSPHQSGPPMHPPMQRGPPPQQQQQMHRGSLGPPSHHGMGQGMPPHMQQHHHDPMRSVSHSQQGGMPQQRQQPQQQQYMQQQQQQNVSQHSTSSNVMSGNWQSDKDTPHRREMIQHMYVSYALYLIFEFRSLFR